MFVHLPKFHMIFTCMGFLFVFFVNVPILWGIILGKKKFLFGDKACEFDCTIFAMVAQLIWQMPGSPIKAYIEGKFF